MSGNPIIVCVYSFSECLNLYYQSTCDLIRHEALKSFFCRDLQNQRLITMNIPIGYCRVLMIGRSSITSALSRQTDNRQVLPNGVVGKHWVCFGFVFPNWPGVHLFVFSY